MISFGQRPQIKDKLHVELAARDEGGKLLITRSDTDLLLRLLSESGADARPSQNAGSSYCNHIYREGLSLIDRASLGTEMVFIHIPYEKNITDADAFFYAVSDALDKYINHRKSRSQS